MPSSALSSQSLTALPLSRRLALAAFTLAIGLTLIAFAGFVPVEAIHNAAHDARHSAAFPCH